MLSEKAQDSLFTKLGSMLFKALSGHRGKSSGGEIGFELMLCVLA